MNEKPRTLTDLLEPGRDAKPRHAIWLRLYQQGRLSNTSREYRLLRTLDYITQSGHLTYLGLNVLKHLRLREEASHGTTEPKG